MDNPTIKTTDRGGVLIEPTPDRAAIDKLRNMGVVYGKKIYIGWVCPHCSAVNLPSVKRCDCE